MRRDGWPSLHPYPRMIQWLSAQDAFEAGERRQPDQPARDIGPTSEE